MNENEIVEQLAKSIPKEPETTDVAKPVASEEPQPSAFEANIELNDPAIGMRIADYYDVSKIDRFSEERQRQMRLIYRWGAEQAQSTELGPVLQKLQTLETELGIRYKPDRLTTVSRWIKLNNQAKALKQEMETLRG